MSSPYLAGISIYPIKSLDPVVVTQAMLLTSGALKHDREFAMFDDQNQFVNGKRNSKVHLLRSTFDVNSHILSLRVQDIQHNFTFHINRERSALEAWLSRYFDFLVMLKQNPMTGFPDDTNAPGPTIISTGTIKVVTSWFPDVSVDEMRLRLRANLEIGGVPAFWEDMLFAEAGCPVQFQIGEVLLEGINPCQRCIVPTRNSQTAEATINFQRVFATKRKESLPFWTTPARFNHFYRLCVNTNIPNSEADKVLQIGDEVKIRTRN